MADLAQQLIQAHLNDEPTGLDCKQTKCSQSRNTYERRIARQAGYINHG
jgi:hypothetical protein